MILCGVLFIPEVFGIRHSFPKFLVLAEALPFSLAFQKEIKNVETCSASAAWQGTGSPVRPSCLHASPFMEVILYQKEGFFHLNGSSFLSMSDLMQMYPWKMGGCTGNPLPMR